MRNDQAMADILLIDDDPAVQRMMCRILGRSSYNVFVANGVQEAFDKIAANLPDLIMLDLSMSMLDDFEVAAHLKSSPETREIPIILIAGIDSSQKHVRALHVRANDFLPKIAAPEEILAMVHSHLKDKPSNDQWRDCGASFKKKVTLRTAQLKEASLEIIWRLTAASEYRDNETGAHIKRMSQYSAAIAKKMGLDKKTVEAILCAAPMHDIGKIGIPDKILLKPDKLDANEWEIMKMHTIIGANILKGSKLEFVHMGAIIAMTHHEKWDGSGYPKGLKQRQIPLAGRIVALADVFDALTSKRPYKEAYSIEKSNRIIKQGRGHHFDPDVVDAFFSIPDQISNIKERYRDDKEIPLFCMAHMIDDRETNSNFNCFAI